MEILNLSLPAVNRFATNYLEQKENILEFFHYGYQDISDYKERLAELNNRSFQRKELADHIEGFMERFPSSRQVKQSIEKLKQDNCVTVIGGQQAGILTGPLYSIHKIISIIVFARQKEKELGVPVVPIFWIAGEDHDYPEVNHIYVSRNQKPEKKVYPERIFEKKMVSDIAVDREICMDWVEEVIETFGETKHTKNLMSSIIKCVNESATFVDFFAMLVMELFKEFGLLLVDSGDRRLRSLERNIFVKQITEAGPITEAVLSQQKELELADFKNTIEMGNDAANLFYYDKAHKERILLYFDRDTQTFSGKDGTLRFTKKQLLHIAEEEPDRLSNNVVTRPLTQECLFPTLAFIGGPGEIAYWSELKKAFEHLGLKMPPIVPRLNMTILERSIERDLAELELDLKDVLMNGTGKNELKYIDSVKDRELENLFRETKQNLENQYRLIEARTRQLDEGLLPLLDKNKSFIFNQLVFMETKIEESICLQHDVILRKFDRVENALRPNGAPQERIWNIFYYINQYGFDFVRQLAGLNYEFDGLHKIIKV